MSRMGIRIVEDRRQWESESARSSPMGIGLLRSSPMGIVEIVEIIANGFDEWDRREWRCEWVRRWEAFGS